MSKPTVRDLPRVYTFTLLWCAVGVTVAVVLLLMERAGL